MKTSKLLLILLVLSLLIFACNLPGSEADNVDDPEPQEEETEVIDDSEGEEEEEIEEPEEPLPVALTCPTESVSGKLVMNHNFSFSPSDDENIKIDGSTQGATAWCVITIEGENVIFDECEFAYNNTGTIKTDDGDCTISGEGVAAIEVTGTCKDGVITLEISEFSEGELGNTMTCPNTSQPYPTFFPPSVLEFDFLIAVGGDSWTHYGAIDFSWTYTKMWTLMLPPDYFDSP